MRIISVFVTLWGCFIWGFSGLHAQDSLKTIKLDETRVNASYQELKKRKTAFTTEVLSGEFMKQHQSGNLMHTLELLPGVRSMDIGSGFSKPMIRGLGFNRIAVAENGMKQEGQQWGSDHGLEIDAFNVEEVTVLKGPASLLYGSDALGGVIEITPSSFPVGNQMAGEAVVLGKSVNRSLGGSLMLSFCKDNWYLKGRYSEQRYGDYRIPADTIVYLTQCIPVYGQKLKNTAGMERHASLQAMYRNSRYRMCLLLSDSYQKAGFFPGAHGVPDISRVQDDGDSRNIGLPFSRVNHLKVSLHQTCVWDGGSLTARWGYQRNRRNEWSAFHTHYDGQMPPGKNPDKELDFLLDTYSGTVDFRAMPSARWEYVAGMSFQMQQNRIGGYSFLLPEYRRGTMGVFLTSTFRVNSRMSITGGIRYDRARLHASAFSDPFLEGYLRKQGYDEALIQEYRWRSYPVSRVFGDRSWALGMVWQLAGQHLLKVNMGRSFRLPGANELASNGVHHGTFLHEQGDPHLTSECGWQFDLSYTWQFGRGSLELTPFSSFYPNFIYLHPTGEWSVLPHAGQIYRYQGARALFWGGELSFVWHFLPGLSYRLTGDCVRNINLEERIALSFTAPASVRQTLTWEHRPLCLYAESHSIFTQKHVDRNEESTPGATILNVGASAVFPKFRVQMVVGNLLGRKYFNHLSYYRKIEIPEPGRNFLLTIQIPFKQLLK